MEGAWWERSSHFLCANTNKRGLTLDLGNPKGIELLRRLIAETDVVIENFTPRVMANFGLEWPTIREINPRCVLVRMPAFGLSGPWRDNTGFAQTMEQVTGLAWLTGHTWDQPRIQRGPSDPNAGMHAAFAALVGLAERDATGEGCQLEVTMVEGALNAAAELAIEFSAYGNRLERDGNRSPGAAPQGLYACAGFDRWLALSIATDEQWRTFVDLLGNPAWGADPELATTAGRRDRHDELDERINAWATDRDAAETADWLVANGIPAALGRDPRLLRDHPQLTARGYYEEVDQRRSLVARRGAHCGPAQPRDPRWPPRSVRHRARAARSRRHHRQPPPRRLTIPTASALQRFSAARRASWRPAGVRGAARDGPRLR